MSSSVLGLGAAALGAAALGMPGFKNAKKQEKSKAAQPSAQDYLNSYLSLMFGDYKGSSEEKIDAAFGGPLKSMSGNFYYGEAPTDLKKNQFVIPGQDIKIQTRTPNAGMQSQTVSTYQLGQITPPKKEADKQEPPMKLNLSHGGKSNVLNTKDIKAALKEGASLKEIKKAAKSQDIKTSAKAKSMLRKAKKNK